ncbi:uncharacterized protein LOC107181066 [Panthera tigris]|uniref:uncharacterized protein LOC107181066 n=1 Tax=Panthera tigris TaxID=9694 RepID=UPI001C6F7FAB|nr:uncharacterized protein LOC107181066 [Panthera tigris]
MESWACAAQHRPGLRAAPAPETCRISQPRDVHGATGTPHTSFPLRPAGPGAPHTGKGTRATGLDGAGAEAQTPRARARLSGDVEDGARAHVQYGSHGCKHPARRSFRTNGLPLGIFFLQTKRQKPTEVKKTQNQRRERPTRAPDTEGVSLCRSRTGCAEFSRRSQGPRLRDRLRLYGPRTGLEAPGHHLLPGPPSQQLLSARGACPLATGTVTRSVWRPVGTAGHLQRTWVREGTLRSPRLGRAPSFPGAWSGADGERKCQFLWSGLGSPLRGGFGAAPTPLGS